jgi:hypothetical protein
LSKSVNWRGIANRVDNLNLSARSVVLVFAVRVDTNARSSRPLPDPVNSDSVASPEGGGNVDVSLAPLLNIRVRLAEDVVRELLLTLDGDGAGVDLVAATIVVVLCSNLRPT